jgi:hypothetical protein
LCILDLAGQLIEHNALANNSRYSRAKPLAIRHFPVVKSERLLIQIPEQVERLDRNVRAADTASKATSNFPGRLCERGVNVLHSVIDDLLSVLAFQSVYDISASLYSAEPASTCLRTSD